MRHKDCLNSTMPTSCQARQTIVEAMPALALIAAALVALVASPTTAISLTPVVDREEDPLAAVGHLATLALVAGQPQALAA
jgi:hypothetical protein